MNWIKNNWLCLAIIIVVLVLLHRCEQDPEIVTKIEYVEKTDTITETIIKEIPKTVYVERTKTVKGKDSIIYVDKPTDSSLTANQYQTTLKSNNASADLEITTTGELLDVSGVIHYTQENKTETIIKAKSGLFLYGQINLNGFDNYGVGLDYTIKNKLIIGASANYDNFSKQFGLGVKIGLKIK